MYKIITGKQFSTDMAILIDRIGNWIFKIGIKTKTCIEVYGIWSDCCVEGEILILRIFEVKYSLWT